MVDESKNEGKGKEQQSIKKTVIEYIRKGCEWGLDYFVRMAYALKYGLKASAILMMAYVIYQRFTGRPNMLRIDSHSVTMEMLLEEIGLFAGNIATFNLELMRKCYRLIWGSLFQLDDIWCRLTKVANIGGVASGGASAALFGLFESIVDGKYTRLPSYALRNCCGLAMGALVCIMYQVQQDTEVLCEHINDFIGAVGMPRSVLDAAEEIAAMGAGYGFGVGAYDLVEPQLLKAKSWVERHVRSKDSEVHRHVA